MSDSSTDQLRREMQAAATAKRKRARAAAQKKPAPRATRLDISIDITYLGSGGVASVLRDVVAQIERATSKSIAVRPASGSAKMLGSPIGRWETK